MIHYSVNILKTTFFNVLTQNDDEYRKKLYLMKCTLRVVKFCSFGNYDICVIEKENDLTKIREETEEVLCVNRGGITAHNYLTKHLKT